MGYFITQKFNYIMNVDIMRIIGYIIIMINKRISCLLFPKMKEYIIRKGIISGGKKQFNFVNVQV